MDWAHVEDFGIVPLECLAPPEAPPIGMTHRVRYAPSLHVAHALALAPAPAPARHDVVLIGAPDPRAATDQPPIPFERQRALTLLGDAPAGPDRAAVLLGEEATRSRPLRTDAAETRALTSPNDSAIPSWDEDEGPVRIEMKVVDGRSAPKDAITDPGLLHPAFHQMRLEFPADPIHLTVTAAANQPMAAIVPLLNEARRFGVGMLFRVADMERDLDLAEGVAYVDLFLPDADVEVRRWCRARRCSAIR